MSTGISDKYYVELAAAFVLGSAVNLPHETLVRMGQIAGLKMHRFRQAEVLPRVSKAIEMLKTIDPVNLLDIGSGMGSGLIRMLVELPNVDITAVEADDALIPNLRGLAKGLHVTRPKKGTLTVIHGDSTNFSHPDGWFDVGTALEVLEHIPDPEKVVKELVRVCRKIVFSVPSEPDDNPRHIHFFPPSVLEEMFIKAGAAHVRYDSVTGHTVGVATVWE